MTNWLLLTLLQCIASDLVTRASKPFDTGDNHFLVKMPLTRCHTVSFYLKVSNHDQKLQLKFNISPKFLQANVENVIRIKNP